MSTIGRKLLVQKYLETGPAFAAPPKFVGADAAVVGRVTVGAGAMLGGRSVIRADGHYIKIGDNLCLSDRATIHIAHELFAAELGDDVTVGENTVVHACSVGDRCYLGDNVIILDGSKVSPQCAIEGDSVVFPGSELESGWLYGGRPAKPIRPIELAEIEAMGRLIAEGKLQPRVTESYPLDDYKKAFRAITERQVRGKVVFRMD